MEPTNNEKYPGKELPPVEGEVNVESFNLATPEVSGNLQAPIPTQNTGQPTTPITSAQPSPQAQASLLQDDDTLIADDTDLIEKEWVDKAKAIVAQTKNDPHLQNKEMTKVKADYLKKRYNKDLKTNEA